MALRRFCTIAARNYLPLVEILVESIRVHHGDCEITVLVVDGNSEHHFGDLDANVLRGADLINDPNTWFQMATAYDVEGLSTALKPYLLQVLLQQGGPVMYLDPDIELFAPCDDLFELASSHGIVLTPHVTQPMGREDLYPSDEVFLLAGQFNLGFIAVSQDALPFISWWIDRTATHCVRRVGDGYFVDQRWLDAVPTLFDHAIVRSPSYNVAHWNLHERHVNWSRLAGWTVNSQPLRFFHFSGFSPDHPHRLSRHFGKDSRLEVLQNPALCRLLERRSVSMIAHTDPVDPRPTPYGFGRSTDGTGLTQPIRERYWLDWQRTIRAGIEAPPHAFEPAPGTAFTTWLEHQGLFGSPTFALQSNAIPTTPLPRSGVNIVGSLEGGFGVGDASLLMSRCWRAAGIPVAHAPARLDVPLCDRAMKGSFFGLTVLSMNADALCAFAETPKYASMREGTCVGAWYWEVGRVPSEHRRAFDLIDEVWCTSAYMASLLTGAGRRVIEQPFAIDLPPKTRLHREDLGLPNQDKTVFGFSFDLRSVMKRKNPIGLIRAYTAAFGENDGAALVLKVQGVTSETRSDMAAITDAVGSRSDVTIDDRWVPAADMQAWYQLIDCYVSLHRAEGLGLTMARAMSAGTPCIATGGTGNLAFMDDSSALLVPAKQVAVGRGAAPYAADAVWLEPDLESAAQAMRLMMDDPTARERLGMSGLKRIQARHSPEHVAPWFAKQFERLVR
jgi:glycosyltransferase involved in cell wall biosynthesis